ncbi:hypothetical protein DV096_18925 [Bradymonadaceae bacterium TMQ3]|uniref:Uncharacterized protein n=1 Tax=Lujinxingia sediminis TaxID=2480984 RepID=A0ABY0CPI6_9DELT|nr:hypothetical protein [Lujinxingia sediminis]RDV36526.1 hypothetical protein DV096_18925 [Bradymonadaceae bacterium TMQ3]RVU42379.1 hypothetical protein EA187_16000 [Lujinxingia sediminis]TXC74578.1 hypothetical protein FRC91_15820 [Bradymonadales bacterium TMQ1]
MNPRQLLAALLATTALACSALACTTLPNAGQGNAPDFAHEVSQARAHLALIHTDTNAYLCACYFEDDGYASPARCLEANSISPHQRQALTDCLTQSALRAPPAPEGVRSFVRLYQRALTDYQACQEAVSPLECSQREFSRRSDCRAAFIETLDAHDADPATARWFEHLEQNAAAAGCFTP